MLSSELVQGRAYRFPVQKERSNSNFFKVVTDDGHEFSLRKFKFQQSLPDPDFIDCYVKSLVPLILGQDISVFIREFYTENQEYDFLIKSKRYDSEVVYELEDDHGLCFKLSHAPETLVKGSRIRCKVLKIRGVNVVLKYAGTITTQLPLDFEEISYWLDSIGIPHFHHIYLTLLESLPEFSGVLKKYENRDPYWIIDIIKTVDRHITDWLIDCRDDLRMLARTVRRMKLVERLGLYILEGSDYLRNCSLEQRTSLQNQISACVSRFSQYELAASKIIDQTYSDFIDGIFTRLKDSGYLYDPKRQFLIMMTIIKLRPELINTRMRELFDALHNWELSNWKIEPFRRALVQQLQIFIEENCHQVNLLPVHDSSDDNRIIVQMITAIAVQRILVNDKEWESLGINSAMLYRYISYLQGGDIDTLLNKAVDAILGIDHANEFSWKDTEHPTLLMMKAAHPAPVDSERSSVVKTFDGYKAMVRLREDSLQILARHADPDSTVLPNNMFDWLNPIVSLDRDVTIRSFRKTNDISLYRDLWNDIRRGLFGNEDDLENREKDEKSKIVPDDGEEVGVIINDVRILTTGNERQRLQFHCKIIDDIYEGEGWMPCDALHMLGWLTPRDIPSNFDGTVNFAQTDTGSPLRFQATVLRQNGELVFSLKNQIDDYLHDTMTPGDEFVAIVTHFDRLNNAWLCLSENGCTFKVPCDESTADICEGRLVRVRYIEPEHSNSIIQFFFAELSGDQEDLPRFLRKSDCLTNLMQGFGEEVENYEEDFEVVGNEDVMSREEFLELIYMLQRRADSETEYIRAFNYLGLASILCRIAEEKGLLEDITAHMELLCLLQDFGRNQKIDREWFEKCGEKIRKTPVLERIYTRLKIVADLNVNEQQDWLWEISHNPRNEIEGRLSSLVLSYNMLPPELERPRKEIMKEITTLLNVNNTIAQSKYYGDESQTVEFKSSMVFSTRGGSRPNPKDQLHEIAHIICGFMNSRGGTLYIGVNDSGYENGLDDDFKYRLSHGLKATLDGMMVDLQNYLDYVMPTHAKDHWEIMSDPDSKKGVICIKTLPVEQPVELDGIIYVRSSSTTKPRLDKDREEFIRTRSHNYNLLLRLWNLEDTKNEETDNVTNAEEDIALVPDETVMQQNDEESSASVAEDSGEKDNTDKIITGQHRPNVLHSYESNFSTPSYYAYFMSDSKIRLTPDDAYLDYEPECQLALAVKDREKGYLVLTYADGRVTRLPLSVFSGFSQNEMKSHNGESPLRFVNIGGEDDYLLTVVKTSYGAIFYRLDSIASLPLHSSLMDIGETLCDVHHKVLMQDIVSPDKVAFFDRDSINRERRYFGVAVPLGDGTKTEQQRIDELLRPTRYNPEA